VKYKVDLDLLKKGSLLGNIIPVLFFDFQEELNNPYSNKGKHDYEGSNKRKIISLFETIYTDITAIDTPDEVDIDDVDDDMDEDEMLERLIKVSSITEIYDNMSELIWGYKKYMEVDSIDIVCTSSINNVLLIMALELDKLKEYDIFDSIELKMWE
jgi:hypothetical protein